MSHGDDGARRDDGAGRGGAGPATGEDPDAARLAEDLKAVHGMLRNSVTAEARRLPVPLTAQQMLTMRVLAGEWARGIEPSMSELTEHLGLSHSTVSGIVTRLERRELVCRTRCADDRRVTRVRLTGQVREWLHHDLPTLWRQPLVDALDSIGAERRTALVEGLAALRAALEE